MERSQTTFRRMFRTHADAVYAYCLRRTNPDDAVDAASEVFLTAWRRMDDMPGDDSALPWLYGVARRVLSRQWRTKSRARRLWQRSRSLADVPPDDPETIVVRHEEFTLALKALDRLSPGDQEVLRLAAWDELPHAVIAGMLGCSVNAVDQRVHRAKRRLARQYVSMERVGGLTRTTAPVTEERGAA